MSYLEGMTRVHVIKQVLRTWHRGACDKINIWRKGGGVPVIKYVFWTGQRGACKKTCIEGRTRECL